MPVNLNALIRYKTINSCLYGGLRKYDINELIEACSGALSESRGKYSRISERTIRDDIRVMRSDILGFNAPIAQNRGLYFYTDPKYTILSVGINDPGILQMVIKSLLRIRSDVKHPEIEKILEKLRSVTPEFFEEANSVESEVALYEKSSSSSAPGLIKRSEVSRMVIKVSWGEVMNVGRST